jgi:hypothetical protein
MTRTPTAARPIAINHVKGSEKPEGGCTRLREAPWIWPRSSGRLSACSSRRWVDLSQRAVHWTGHGVIFTMISLGPVHDRIRPAP